MMLRLLELLECVCACVCVCVEYVYLYMHTRFLLLSFAYIQWEKKYPKILILKLQMVERFNLFVVMQHKHLTLACISYLDSDRLHFGVSS